jgi:hypothetical protein
VMPRPDRQQAAPRLILGITGQGPCDPSSD